MKIPEKALQWIRGGKSFLILGHKGPDGDCLGSMSAFLGLVRKAGGEGRLLLEKSPPGWFDFLPGLEGAQVWEERPELPEAEVLVLLDCHRLSRVGAPGKALEGRGGKVLVMDHHRDEGDFPPGFESVRVLDPSAAATALLVLDLFRSMEVKPSPDEAAALLTGILTDTNWLQNSNTDQRVFRALDYLHEECGPSLPSWRIYDLVFRRYPEGTARLMGKALSGARLEGEGGKLAYVTVERKDIVGAGFRQFESEILTRPLLSMETVAVTAVLYELEEGGVKFSIRSKGGGEALALARFLGGGGHPEAAGAEFQGSLREAADRLLEGWRSLP